MDWTEGYRRDVRFAVKLLETFVRKSEMIVRVKRQRNDRKIILKEIRISLKVTGQNVRLEDLVAAKEGRKHEVIQEQTIKFLRRNLLVSVSFLLLANLTKRTRSTSVSSIDQRVNRNTSWRTR